MEVGSFAEDSDAFIVLLGLLALDFAPFLVELPYEVEMCCLPRLIAYLFPVVQEFGLEQACTMLFVRCSINYVQCY